MFRRSEHWLARAEEARKAAAHITDPAAQRAMLKVAENYEKIAKRAEAQEAGVAMPENAKQHEHEEPHD